MPSSSALSPLRLVHRHGKSFAAIFLTGTALSFAAIHNMPQSYHSRAVLEFKNDAAMLSALSRLQSSETLDTVIADLDLAPPTQDKSAGITFDTSQFKSLNLFEASPENSAQPSTKNAEPNHAASTIVNSLEVKALNHANQIEISVHAPSADLAARIGNAVAQLEIQNATRTSAKNNTIFQDFAQKIEAMQGKIAALDQEILNTKAQYAMAALKSEHEYTQKYAALQRDIETLQQEKENLAKQPQKPATEIAALTRTGKDLKAQKRELSKRYGEKHPQMLALSKKIKNAEHRLAMAQANTQAPSAKTNEIEERLAFLEIELANLAPAAGELDTGEIDALEQERKTLHHALSGLLNHQTQNAKKLRRSDEAPELALAATPQIQNASPSKPVLMAYAAGLFALLGLFPAGFGELRRRKTFQSAEEMENATGRPCFGKLPLVKDFADKNVADFILCDPQSQISESLRALRMQLKLRAPRLDEKSAQIIMMSSAGAHEGKTTTALWLARQAAQSGMRTILVDADLRTPSVHKFMNADNTVSLVDVLTGRKLLEHAVRKDVKTGLHVLLASQTPNSASDLLCSDKMAIIFATLRKNYDLVIVDAHSSLAVSDSRAIAPHADQILFMVRWNATPRELVHSGIKEISGFSTAPIATVLAAIDVEEHAKFAFGDVICSYENA